MERKIRRIASPCLLSENGKLLRNGVVEFDHKGRVLSVAAQVGNIDSLPSTEYYNGILMPGMVNAHCHLELSYFKGAIPQHTGLVEFIKYVIGHRNDYTVEDRIAALKYQDRQMWSEGVQAVGDVSNDAFSFETKAESPVYYHTFVEYLGMPTAEKAHEVFGQTSAIVKQGRRLGLAATPTPHSTYMVSDSLFRMGASSPRLSVHFMETPSELGLFRREGGMYEYLKENDYKPDFLQYGSHPARLVGSLHDDSPILLVHNTMIGKEDVERILAHFKDVTFVLCPRSNYYIEKTFPPAIMLRDMRCRIALGTDSLSSNTSLSVAEEIKWLLANNPSLDMGTVLGWATMGGAEGLGIGAKIGSFTPGKIPGAVLLTDIDWKTMRPTDKTRAKRIL